jgi:flagellar operon protein
MNQEWLLGVKGPLPVRSHPQTRPTQKQGAAASSFQDELNKQLQPGVVLSQHAKQRLEKRDIRLSETDLARIGDAINKVAAKGGKDSLIFLDNTAFVVNVKNRTIITAVDQMSLHDNVFTNIDSAMIL